MTDADLPAPLTALVAQHMSSMDHVALLLELHATPEERFSSDALAEAARIEPGTAERVLRDLVAARLAQREGNDFQYAPAPEVREAVDLLAEMYRTKPVTLVRAIYARPARAAQTFADAFRLRRPEE